MPKRRKKIVKSANKVSQKNTGKKKSESNKKQDESKSAKKSAIVRELIRVGKDKGFLSYDEVNEILPAEIVSSDEIDEVIATLQDEDIKLIDSDEEEKIPLAVKRGQKRIKIRKVVQIDDPVKMLSLIHI